LFPDRYHFSSYLRSLPVLLLSESPSSSGLLENKSQIYITTNVQLASLSWNKARIWGLRPYLYYCHTVAEFVLYGALPLTIGRVCHLLSLLALVNVVIFGYVFRGTRDHILLSLNRNFNFCLLLRLAGLRWRYSIPPPGGFWSASKSK
jgi:hypothetical protein